MAIADYPSISSTPLDILELRHRRRDSVLTQLVAAASRLGLAREPEVLLATLLRAERLACSALGKAVAVPHARSLAIARPGLLLGRSTRGLEWGVGEDAEVQLVVMVLSPGDQPVERHLDRVSAVALALRQQRVRARLMTADAAGVLATLVGVGT